MDKASCAFIADSVSYSNASDKPSTYIPSYHTHTWNDIANKPSIPSSHKAHVTESWNSGVNGYRYKFMVEPLQVLQSIVIVEQQRGM